MHSGNKAVVSDTITRWDEQLRGFGKVVLPQKTSKIVSAFVLVIASVGIGLFIGYRSSDNDSTALLWAAGIIIPLLLLTFAWPMLWSRNKTIVVETDGVRLTNKKLVPWSEIVGSGIWSYRGNTMVTLKVTDAYMREYLSTLPAAVRMLTRLNSAMSLGNTLYLPSMLDAKPEELRDWLAMLIERRESTSSSYW